MLIIIIPLLDNPQHPAQFDRLDLFGREDIERLDLSMKTQKPREIITDNTVHLHQNDWKHSKQQETNVSNFSIQKTI